MTSRFSFEPLTEDEPPSPARLNETVPLLECSFGHGELCMPQTHDSVPTGELASTSLNLIVVAVAFDVTDSALIGQFVAHAFVGVDSPVRVNFVVAVTPPPTTTFPSDMLVPGPTLAHPFVPGFNAPENVALIQ